MLKHYKKILSLALVMLFIILSLNNLYSINYYIKPTGDNTLSGNSWANAWQTINHAVSNIAPGDVVIVSNGTYTEMVTITNKGSAGNYITFRSFQKHQAVIDGLQHCINMNSAQYIRIENFHIKSANNDHGIYMVNISFSNTIMSNLISDNADYGIFLNGEEVDNNRISGNEIYNTGSLIQNYGIRINDSDNNCIENNSIHDHVDYGIFMTDTATNTSVINNKIYQSGRYGIRLHDSTVDKNRIIENYIYGPNQNEGIYMYQASQNTIRSNYIYNNINYGIRLSRGARSNNIINNKIYSNQNGSGIILYESSSSTTYRLTFNNIISNHIYVNGMNHADTNGCGIYISEYADNNLIKENIIHHNQKHGIRIRNNCDNNMITNNIIVSNNDNGIYYESDTSDNNNIIDNQIYGPDQVNGIYIKDSDYITIKDNNIYNHTTNGIIMQGTLIQNNISNNYILNNTKNGITLFGGTGSISEIYHNEIKGPYQVNGIVITNWNNITISSNEIMHNTNHGILIQQRTENIDIYENLICSNKIAGIYILSNSTLQAEIYNNKIYGPEQQYGIYLSSTSNILLHNTTCLHHHDRYGVYLKGSLDNIQITNSIISSNVESGIGIESSTGSGNHIYNNIIQGPNQDYGVYITNANNFSFNSNQIVNHDFYGIYILDNSYSNSFNSNLIFNNNESGFHLHGDNVQWNTALNNTIFNHNEGIYILQGKYNDFRYQTIYNNLYGVYLDASTYSNQIRNSTIFSNRGNPDSSGIIIKDIPSSDNINMIENNQIFHNPTGIRATNTLRNHIGGNNCYSNHYGVVILGGNPGNGVTGSGTTLENNTIRFHKTGVFVRNAYNAYIRSGNNISNNTNGIHLTGITYPTGQELGTYISNTSGIIKDNIEKGIFIDGTAVDYTVIRDTTIDNSPIGIHINNGDNAYSYGCYIINHDIGILIENSAVNNMFHQAQLFNNSSNAIIMESGPDNLIFECNIYNNNDTGILIKNANGNYICKNVINNNLEDGIDIINSDSTKIQKNEIYDHSGNDGISIDSTSDSSLIINNTIYNNNLGIDNANSSSILKNLITRSNQTYGINCSAGVTVTYSCLNDNYNGIVYDAATCITSDPQFCDEQNDDFYLRWQSPCIGTGETNIRRSCMGAHTLYVRLFDYTAGNVTAYTLYFTTTLHPKIGEMQNDAFFNIFFDEEVVGKSEATNATGTSRWGNNAGTFSVTIPFDGLDTYIHVERNSGNTTFAGDTENLIINSLINSAIGSNHRLWLGIRPDAGTSYYSEFERSNDYCITGFTNFFVQWSHASASDANPGTRNLPWKTLQYAANRLKPGEVVTVLPGTQPESVHISNSGQPWGRVITYKAEGEVFIDPPVGTNSFGFFVDDVDWVRINGFKIINATNGLHITDSYRVLTLSNQAYNNIKSGYRIINSEFCPVRYCRLYNNQSGLFLSNTKTNWIRGNRIYDNGHGAIFDGVITDAIIYENTLTANTNGGFYFIGGDNNLVTRNYILNGHYFGMKITNGNHYKVTLNSNTICTNGLILSGSSFSNYIHQNYYYNSGNGIVLDGYAKSNYISQNNCSNSKKNGFLITDNASYNFILTNNANNGSIGLTLSGGDRNIIGSMNTFNGNNTGINIFNYSHSNTILNNEIMANQTNGIQINNSSRNIIDQNEIRYNQYDGIQIEGISINNQILNNTLLSNNTNSIIIDGDNTDQTSISNNSISISKIGIKMIQADYSSIKSNNIFQNQISGITILSGCNYSLIEGNNIFENECTLFNSGGIFLSGKQNYPVCNNKIENNNIFQNGTDNNDSGIYMDQFCLTNQIFKNNISNNTNNGVFLNTGSSYNIISNNNIYNSYNAHVIILSRENKITHNRIHHSFADNGIWIQYGDHNSICSNIIYKNNQSGIVLYRDAQSNIIKNNLIYSNTCTNNYNGGIAIDGYNAENSITRTIIISNSIFNNGRDSTDSGIYIRQYSFSNIIQYNNISFNQPYGIYVNTSYNRIEYNTLFSNGNDGFTAQNGARYNRISHNDISYHQNTGIYVFDITNLISYNKIFKNQGNGIYCRQHTTIKSNSIFSNVIGINIAYRYNTIYSNNIYANSSIGLNLPSNVCYGNQVGYNSIHGPGQSTGFYCFAGDGNTLFSNRIYRNSGGVNISGTWSPVSDQAHNNRILNNIIYSNSSFGVFCNYDAHSTSIFNNKIYGPGQNRGITFGGGKTSRIFNNQIHHNTDEGIRFYEQCRNNVITNNNIYSNGNYGIHLSSGNFSWGVYGHRIMNNNIYGPNQNYGIYCRQRAYSCTFAHNNIKQHDNWGIWLRGEWSGGDFTIEDNTICSNVSGGLLFDAYAGNVVNNNVLRRNKIYGPNQDYGLRMIDGNNNRIIQSNYFYNHDITGIDINSCDSTQVTNNVIYNNNDYGIRLNAGANAAIIYSNQIYGTNQDAAIYCNGSDNGVISHNTLYKHRNSGIIINSTANNNQFLNNTVYSNQSNGISIIHNSVNNNYINKNQILGSRQKYGIRITAAGNIFISQSNQIYNHDHSGCYIQGGTGIVINSNTIFSNNIYGVYLDSGSSGVTLYTNYIFGPLQGSGIYINNSSAHQVSGNYIYKHLFSGLCISNSAQNNQITKNIIYSNNNFGLIISGDDADNNIILSNYYFSTNQDISILIKQGDNNQIKNNIIKQASLAGISIEGTALDNNVFNNILFNNNKGIYLNNTSSCSLWRNALFANADNGIELDNANNISIINNSLASNQQDGINIDGSSPNTIIKNCIICFSGQYGINTASGGILTYNDIFDNLGANYNGITPGTGTITNNPLWINMDPASSNFLYLSNISLCVDSGDPSDTPPVNGGSRIDMGWKECTRPYLRISFSKSISNVTQNSINSTPIPGATINYKIQLSLVGNRSGQNLIIYDKVHSFTTFATSEMISITGWTLEYSTNSSPDQSYYSTSYLTDLPAKTNIKWIRWRTPLSDPGDKTFIYKITIN